MKKSLLKLAFGMLALSFGVTSLAQTTFNYTGAVQTYTVPVGVTSIQIETWGAEGGGNNTPGKGGYAIGNLSVTPSQVLYVYVGEQGKTNSTRGSGGGASDVRTVNGNWYLTASLNSRVIVGAGGGGSGNNPIGIGGDGGGSNGADGSFNNSSQGGQFGLGATQIAGGSYDVGAEGSQNCLGGMDGYFGGGGDARYVGRGNTCTNTNFYEGLNEWVYRATHGAFNGGGTYDKRGGESGGGGGGWYGGGAPGSGDYGGGGGGGSSYIGGVTLGSTTPGLRSGAGQVVITVLCSPLNLSVTPADTVCLGTPVTITGTSINSGTITWDNGITNGVSFPNTVAGVTTYTSTSTDINDCVAQVVINVLAAKTGSVTNTICNNGSVVVNGNTYDANTPTGTEVISNVGPFNCDSTVTVNLNVLAAKTGSVTNTICNNGSVVVNGNTYDANTPTGTEVFTNVGPNNCDSTVTVNLNVLAVKTGSVTNALCDGGSIIVNGNTYNAGNLTGTEVFTNVGPNNCDSTVTVNITILPALTGSVTNALCGNDSIVVNGTTYNAGNPTGTEIFTNVGPSMCDSTVTVNLTINPLPTVAIAAFTPDTVCDSDPAITLPVGTPALGTYSGTGVVGTTFDPNTAGVGAHYVTYSFTDGNSCTSMDSTMIVVISCVGIDENGTLAGVNIYPNPTNNILNITLGNITSDVNLTLTSVEGKVVYQENNVSNNKVSVDISNNSKGIYFLKVEANNQYKVYKVIKE